MSTITISLGKIYSSDIRTQLIAKYQPIIKSLSQHEIHSFKHFNIVKIIGIDVIHHMIEKIKIQGASQTELSNFFTISQYQSVMEFYIKYTNINNFSTKIIIDGQIANSYSILRTFFEQNITEFTEYIIHNYISQLNIRDNSQLSQYFAKFSTYINAIVEAANIYNIMFNTGYKNVCVQYIDKIETTETFYNYLLRIIQKIFANYSHIKTGLLENIIKYICIIHDQTINDYVDKIVDSTHVLQNINNILRKLTILDVAANFYQDLCGKKRTTNYGFENIRYYELITNSSESPFVKMSWINTEYYTTVVETVLAIMTDYCNLSYDSMDIIRFLTKFDIAIKIHIHNSKYFLVNNQHEFKQTISSSIYNINGTRICRRFFEYGIENLHVPINIDVMTILFQQVMASNTDEIQIIFGTEYLKYIRALFEKIVKMRDDRFSTIRRTRELRLTDIENDVEYCNNIVELSVMMEMHDNTIFHRNTIIIEMLRQFCLEMMNLVMNLDDDQSIQQVQIFAQYLNTLVLKKYANTISDVEYNEKLMTIFRLYNYCRDRDVFQLASKKHLSRRLLSTMTLTNIDIEENLISRMLIEFGSSNLCMNQMMEMIQNRIKSTDELTTIVRNSGFDIAKYRINVLKFAAWPNMIIYDAKMPPIIADFYQNIIRNYSKIGQYTERSLMPIYSIGRILINMQIMSNTSSNAISKQLQLSPIQAAVLFFINDSGDKMINTPEKIAIATGIDVKYIMQSIGPLTAEKNEPGVKPGTRRLIRIVPPIGNTGQVKFTPKSVLEINRNFSPIQKKITFPTVFFDETVDKKELTQERIFQIQACLVRVLKMRKTIMYNDLLSEAIQMLSRRFQPNMRDIKSILERLIEDQYCEREADDMNKLTYIA